MSRVAWHTSVRGRVDMLKAGGEVTMTTGTQPGDRAVIRLQRTRHLQLEHPVDDRLASLHGGGIHQLVSSRQEFVALPGGGRRAVSVGASGGGGTTLALRL